MENKICPLSFSFVVKQIGESPPLSVPATHLAKVRISAKIGFPCITSKCAWWDSNSQQCIIRTIEMLLGEILNKGDTDGLK